jgi:transposase InsO family protein
MNLRLRHEGLVVNLKRVRRLYREEQLMVRRRKRKKVALGDRQPLLRPSRQNEAWSVDFVFDRPADGGSLKCLTVVDDCTHEAVAVYPDRAMSGAYVARKRRPIAEETPVEILAIKSEFERALRKLNSSISAAFLVWNECQVFDDDPKYGISAFMQRKLCVVDHAQPKHALPESYGNTLLR